MIKFPQGRDTYSRSVGMAATVLAESQAKGRSFEYVNRVLWPAVRHGQIGFVSTQHHGESAFFVWATLHPYSVERIIAEGKVNLWESDWSEEGPLVILDIVSRIPLRKSSLALIYQTLNRKSQKGHGPPRRVRPLSQRALPAGSSVKLKLCCFNATTQQASNKTT